MENRFRFSMSSLLVAATLTAVWCGLFVNRGKVPVWLAGSGKMAAMDTADYVVWSIYLGVVVGLPAAILGVLARRSLLGALCGAASGAVVVLIFMGTRFNF